MCPTMSLTVAKHGLLGTNAARRAWILLELARRGLTLKSLSTRTNYSYLQLRQAMVRSRPAAERKIAAAIERTPEFIWPDRYSKKKCARRTYQTTRRNP